MNNLKVGLSPSFKMQLTGQHKNPISGEITTKGISKQFKNYDLLPFENLNINYIVPLSQMSNIDNINKIHEDHKIQAHIL